MRGGKAMWRSTSFVNARVGELVTRCTPLSWIMFAISLRLSLGLTGCTRWEEVTSTVSGAAMQGDELKHLFDKFRDSKVTAASAVPLFGTVVDKSDDAWTLEPSAALSWVSEVEFSLDDLYGRRGLLTDVELLLNEPWRVTSNKLGSLFGHSPEEIPAAPSSGARRMLSVSVPAAPGRLGGMLLFELKGQPVQDPNAEMPVTAVTLRRFFGP